MKTGIEIIAKERQEQIEKHGHSIKSDVDFNTENQLVSAIMMMAANIGFVRAGIKMPKEAFEELRPEGWGREICWGMLSKPIIQQLGIIGAFAASEIDRLNAIEESKELPERVTTPSIIYQVNNR